MMFLIGRKPQMCESSDAFRLSPVCNARFSRIEPDMATIYGGQSMDKPRQVLRLAGFWFTTPPTQ